MICILNVFSIRSLVEDPPHILKNLVRPLLAACLMGVAVWLCWWSMSTVGISSRVLLAGVPVCVGVVVYVIAAIVFKVITREDCLLLPKGEKIAKLLKL